MTTSATTYTTPRDTIALGKKLGLIVTSAKEGDGARVYRISPGLA